VGSSAIGEIWFSKRSQEQPTPLLGFSNARERASQSISTGINSRGRPGSLSLEFLIRGHSVGYFIIQRGPACVSHRFWIEIPLGNIVVDLGLIVVVPDRVLVLKIFAILIPVE
jgi:hypothetical protein